MKKILLASVICLVLLPAYIANSQEIIQLPKPQLQKAVTLEEAINKVRTDKIYTKKALRVADLSLMLWAAAGKRFYVDAVSSATRTYPSGFAIYSVRLYVLVGEVEGIKAGIYQYVPNDHALKLMKKGDLRSESIKSAVYAGSVTQAPATIVLAADLDATRSSYGERPILGMEVGCLAQTVRMVAASAGIGVGMVSLIDPATFRDLFSTKEAPLLFLPLGYPYR
jgi:SagB-type dehydrogenase family enzyme